MIILFEKLYQTNLSNPYFVLQEERENNTTYRVCWAARLTDGKIINEWDWCYLSGEYQKSESAQRRLHILRKRNEQQNSEREMEE